MSDELTKAREALAAAGYCPIDHGIAAGGERVACILSAGHPGRCSTMGESEEQAWARHLRAALADVTRLTLAAQALLRALDAHEDDSEEGNVEAYSTRWADDVYEAKSNLRDEMSAALEAAKEKV